MALAISISGIADFQECRLKRHYRHTERLVSTAPAAKTMRVGVAVHASIEVFHRAELEQRSLELLVTNFDMAWAEARERAGENYDEKSWAKSRQNGHLMLHAFWMRFGKDEELYPLATEVRLERPWGMVGGEEVTIVGIADGLRTASPLLIHELKTSTRASTAPIRWLYLHQQHKLLGWLCGAKTFEIVYTLLSPAGAARHRASLHTLDQTKEFLDSIVPTIVADRQHVAAFGATPPPTESYMCERCEFMELCVARVQGTKEVFEDVLRSGYKVREHS